MKTRRAILLAGGAALAALAQEGHPLTGTWHGSWGGTNDVTLVMFWEGTNLAGIINPGFDSMRMENIRLDPKGWLVHIEADSKEGRIAMDGKIENVTNARRSIVGTWTQGNRKSEFKIVRDN
jgi:hypothetical protein